MQTGKQESVTGRVKMPVVRALVYALMVVGLIGLSGCIWVPWGPCLGPAWGPRGGGPGGPGGGPHGGGPGGPGPGGPGPGGGEQMQP